MEDSFDAAAYAGYLRQRWRFLALVCTIAAFATLAVSLMLPKRYTATASIVIDPPAGNDVRTATAVSPVYLESLKSYEYFAGGDTLFRKALEHFHLRVAGDGAALEGLKRRVLKVSKVRDTRILEISATLEDPKAAQALAQYMAEQTLLLNRDLAQAGDQDLIEAAEKQQSDTSAEFEKRQSAWTELNVREPVISLQSEIEDVSGLRARVRRELLQAQVDAAEDEQAANGKAAGTKARVALLDKQAKDLDREVQQKSMLLAQLSKARELAMAQLRAAQTAYEAAANRLREVRGSVGYRGERLRIVDPGIVPERPSSPNIPLNIVVALGLALIGSLVYLGITFQHVPVRALESLRGALR